MSARVVRNLQFDLFKAVVKTVSSRKFELLNIEIILDKTCFPSRVRKVFLSYPISYINTMRSIGDKLNQADFLQKYCGF